MPFQEDDCASARVTLLRRVFSKPAVKKRRAGACGGRMTEGERVGKSVIGGVRRGFGRFTSHVQIVARPPEEFPANPFNVVLEGR
jgi:hypothetical protein